MYARRTAAAAATVTALVAGLVTAQSLGGAAPARAAGLAPYVGCDELVEHYRSQLRTLARNPGYGYGGMEGDVVLESSAGSGRATEDSAAPGAVGSGPTGTNVQEQGVDEPDLAKLADGRLVVLVNDTIKVLSAEATPRLLGSVRVGDDQSYAAELLLVDDRALVVSTGWHAEKQPQDGSGDDPAVTRLIAPGHPTTTLTLYDVSDGAPRLLESSEYGAQYVSARLVDGTVRLVTTKTPQVPMVWPMGPAATEHLAAKAANEGAAGRATRSDLLPQVTRTDASGRVMQQGDAVGCGDTYHARDSKGASTLMVSTLRPSDSLAPVDSKAVTTDGDLVYSSVDRLYVATSRWGTVMPVEPGPASSSTSGASADEVTTEVHAFDLTSDTVSYVGSGSVPGYVYGRWAFSEHESILRVATTRQPPWRPEVAEGDQPKSSSMVVKLAEQGGRLVETGRVEGLGKTEQIQAVRYFGDLAAVVTFRQTDPLYLIDLSDEPKVLGELKIPGFSTYLHPLGDGLLLGVGNEATEQGQITGMQLSVFDISDPAAPRQVDRLQLGQGWSPALDDSRAFGYDPNLRLATLPVITYDETTYLESAAALGIQVSADGVLSKVGEVAIGPDGYSARVLHGEGSLFVASSTGIVTADPATMSRTGSVAY